MAETPAARCERLLAALEDLARREALAVTAGDLEFVPEIQERAAALLDDLSKHVAGLTGAGASARIAAVRALRRTTAERLAGQIDRARDALTELQVSGRRLSRISPAYAPAAAPGRAFKSVG